MYEQGYSDKKIKNFQVYESHKHLHVGREGVDDDSRSAGPQGQ